MQTAEIPPWESLATRLRPFVRRRVAGDSDADDVLQDILLRMYRGLPGVRDADRLDAWMYRVARTAIADHLRVRARHPVASEVTPSEDLDEPFADDSGAVAERLAEGLAFFVALLPSPYREAVTLVDLENRTHKDAAEMLGISLSGMKSRVQRGRARIRALLEQCCEIALDARGRIIACEPRPATGCGH